jgi:TPR repeat protein
MAEKASSRSVMERELVEEGARLGCHHCQGVMACKSSLKNSRYGLFVLGGFCQYGRGGVAQDYAQALALYRLAAAQNFDGAQSRLGHIYDHGLGVVEDDAEALRWYQLAAIQGYPPALYMVAFCHEKGHGVPVDVAEAIRWYRCAQAAGNSLAAGELQRLNA